MKRALSLILAVVMVALMIPFAAITSFAETTTAPEVLHETDFTKWAADGNANATTAAGQTIKLPEGWVAPAQVSTDIYSEVNAEYGVLLGGENMGIGTTVNPVEGKSTYVIEVTWSTPYKFCVLRFGFADAAFTADKIWSENQIAYYFTGGIGNKKAFTEGDQDGLACMLATSNKAASIADKSVGNAEKNLVMSTEVKDANGDIVPVDASRLGLLGQAATGKDFKTFIEVVDGKVAYIHMQSEGARYTFTPAVEVKAGGYFSIWHTNWGTKNSMNVKSVKFVDGAYVPEDITETTNVVHAYDVASAATLEDIPYDINNYNDAEKGITAEAWLENGTLWQKVSQAGSKTIHSSSNIKIDGSLLPANNTYTLEAVIAAGSTSDILWFDFGMNDDAASKYGWVDGNAFKIRLNDANLSSDTGMVQLGTTYNNTTAFPASMTANYKNGSDITVRAVVYEGYLVGAYVTIAGETAIVCHANGIHSAPAGDIGIVQRHQAEVGTAQVGIKSVKIYDAPMFDYDRALYSVDFSTVKDDAALAAAGWHSITKPETKFTAVSYVDGGIQYSFNNANNLMLDAVKFDAEKSYVVEYNFVWNPDTWIAVAHFNHQNTTDYIDPSTTPDSNGIKYRAKSRNYSFDTHLFYYDAACTQAVGKNMPDADGIAALNNGANVTMKILINKGFTKTVELTVGNMKYYLKASNGAGLAVADGGMFGFTHIGGANASRSMILKDFAVYETYTPATVVVDGKVHDVTPNTTIDFTEYGALAVKVDGAYVAPAKAAVVNGKTYEVTTPNSINLTKGAADLRVDPNGIRFTTTFDAADLQTLMDLYEAELVKSVEFGTLITTTPWATAAGAVTHEALDAVAGDKTAYIEVMATVGEWYAENTFAGTVSTTNTEREYQAVGFAKITLADNSVVTVYSAANTATIASVTPAPEA